MKVSNSDKGRNTVNITIETDDDLWHLYNVIEVNDLITASTTRREEKANDKIRAERTEKKRMTLGIRAEKIEFSEDDFRLKILGTIESGPQDIGQQRVRLLRRDPVPHGIQRIVDAFLHILRTFQNIFGKYMFGTLIASTKNGAISIG